MCGEAYHTAKGFQNINTKNSTITCSDYFYDVLDRLHKGCFEIIPKIYILIYYEECISVVACEMKDTELKFSV